MFTYLLRVSQTRDEKTPLSDVRSYTSMLAPTSLKHLPEVKETWCLMSTETMRVIRDGEKGGKGVWWGEEGDYIPIATLSPPE